MTMNRRQALGSLATSALAVPALARAADQPVGYTPPKPEIEGQALINKDRAYDVMEEYGLAGLIALDPINVYYMTNVTTIGRKFITEYPGFATMAPDPDMPVYLVSGSSAAWDIANRDRETAELIPYGFGGWNEAEFNSDGLPVEPTDGVTRNYHFRDDIELTAREQRWKAASDSFKDDIAAGAAWGLARALKAQGIIKGRVAVDDMRIARFLAEVDLPNLECVDGYGIFQLIRMVKTEQELAYQKVGSWNNGEACLATINALQAGMRHSDVEQIFLAECAIRGNHVNSVIAGMPGGNFPDDRAHLHHRRSTQGSRAAPSCQPARPRSGVRCHQTGREVFHAAADRPRYDDQGGHAGSCGFRYAPFGGSAARRQPFPDA